MGLITKTPNNNFKLSAPCWVDFFCGRGEWVEAFVFKITEREFCVRYEESFEERIPLKELNFFSKFHTKVSPLRNQDEKVSLLIEPGCLCQYYSLKREKWVSGKIIHIDRGIKDVKIVSQSGKEHHFHINSNYVSFHIGENEGLNFKMARKKKRPLEMNENLFREKLYYNRGFSIYDVKNDGNCLFRAVSHQIYGSEQFHKLVRQKCVDYLKAEKAFFKNFLVGGDINFDLHCQQMRQIGVWGDHLEIQAISELYNRPVEIYEYETVPIKTYKKGSPAEPIKLSYHKRSHYNSVTPLANLNQNVPGVIEEKMISNSFLRSKQAHLISLRRSDREETERATMESAIEQSLKDFELEKQVKRESDDSERLFAESVRRCIEEFGFSEEESVEAFSAFSSTFEKSIELDKLVESMAEYILEKRSSK